MSNLRLPWPQVNDAFLIALGIQVVLAVAGHFIGFLGRYFAVTSVLVSAFMGFILGVWSNPTPAMVSGLGGALVGGGSALIGAAIVFFLGDAKQGTLLWVVLIALLAGVIFGAIGSLVGRSVFGA